MLEQDPFAIAPDEISIQSRSLLAMISFLAKGVDVPNEDREAGRVVLLPDETKKALDAHGVLRIRSQKEKPVDPYVAIRYRNYWFYIDNTDTTSKRTFSTLQVLFQLQAPSRGNKAPLLTLPTG